MPAIPEGFMTVEQIPTWELEERRNLLKDLARRVDDGVTSANPADYVRGAELWEAAVGLENEYRRRTGEDMPDWFSSTARGGYA